MDASLAPRPRLAAVVLAVALAGLAGAQTPKWEAEFLGAPQPGWSTTWAVAVNDAGLVVGNTYLSGYKHGWVSRPDETLELLPLPAGATYSQVHDLNAGGVVVGSVLMPGNVSRAAIWRPGPNGYQVVLLPSGPGGHLPFDAQGINDRGDVVGKYGILGGSYHWSESTGITQLTYSEFPKVPVDVNEQRQILGGTYRMDLDTMALEDLGNPTGTGYNYMFTELGALNDVGECVGYGVTATSSDPYLPVRYTDNPGGDPVWKVFSNFPLHSANALGIAASGDTVFQLGIYGTYLHVNGVGSIAVEDLVEADSGWDLGDSFVPATSRGGRLACNGANTGTGQAGIVLLNPIGFDDLGGGKRGALGTPVLSGFGELAPGDPTRVRLASAAPDSLAFLTFARGLSAPMNAAVPKRFVELPTDPLGRFDLTFPWPGTLAGETWFLQAVVFDPAAKNGKATSNVLRAVTQ